MMEGIEIQPPPPIGRYYKCPHLKLASALMSISPLMLKCKEKQRKAMEYQIKCAKEFNSDNLICIPIEPVTVVTVGTFYSDEIGENCMSSKDFIQFSPIKDKDQLVYCAKTKQLVFLIPRSNNSFDKKSQQSLQRCLLRTLGKPSVFITYFSTF